MSILKINTDNTMNELKMSKNNYMKTIKENIYNKGYNEIELLFSWIYEDYVIKLYGFYEGIDEFINIHEIPSYGISEFLDVESSNTKLYGDIFIVKLIENKVIKFTIEDYGEFYNIMYDNFEEDYESESYEDELINDETDSCNLNYDYKSTINYDKNELDNDLNDYLKI